MDADHKVWMGEDDEDPDRGIWECSCGHSGSGPMEQLDFASDKHINPGESRVDTNKRFP